LTVSKGYCDEKEGLWQIKAHQKDEEQ
jgi:hypothetical protein